MLQSGEKTRIQAMHNCCYNCAQKNPKTIERAFARRKKHVNLETYFGCRVEKPTKGTKPARHEEVLCQFYMPQEGARIMRC
jgi:hypothetical protein